MHSKKYLQVQFGMFLRDIKFDKISLWRKAPYNIAYFDASYIHFNSILHFAGCTTFFIVNDAKKDQKIKARWKCQNSTREKQMQSKCNTKVTTKTKSTAARRRKLEARTLCWKVISYHHQRTRRWMKYDHI